MFVMFMKARVKSAAISVAILTIIIPVSKHILNMSMTRFVIINVDIVAGHFSSTEILEDTLKKPTPERQLKNL